MITYKTACELSTDPSPPLSLIISKALIALRNDDRGLDAKELLGRIDDYVRKNKPMEVMNIIYEYIIPLTPLRKAKK